tara:strand:- start:448 stop:1023 length:576 start_codon:yes stop_codon:yes gene_type:complete
MNFEMKKLQRDCPVMIAKIPDLIMEEIDTWVEESKKIKDHPLAELKAHENYGYIGGDGKKHNSYQTSVPSNLVEQSFWLAWTIRLIAENWGDGYHHREYQLSKNQGHFDGYDIWTNFSYKGDDNPTHSHSGSISGVIYYKNHDHATYFDDYNTKYDGYNGTMIMFPSAVRHHVKEQLLDEERITIAFNMID